MIATLIYTKSRRDKQRIIQWAARKPGIVRMVNHGHLKAVSKTYLKPPKAEFRYLSDKTKHVDIYLSNIATKAAFRAIRRDMPIKRAVAVISHLMLNLAGMSYRQEALWHERHAKKLRKLAKTVTAKKDHGWELKDGQARERV